MLRRARASVAARLDGDGDGDRVASQPGGKLELGEEPADCAAREVQEESGWDVAAGPLLDVWMYQPIPDRHVFIVTYGCGSSARSRPRW